VGNKTASSFAIITENASALCAPMFFLNIQIYLKSGRNHGLTCYDGSKDRYDKTGIEHPWRNRVEERIGVCTGMFTDIRRLTYVLEDCQRVLLTGDCIGRRMRNHIPPEEDTGMQSTTS